jgi:hypothetical protein
VDENNVVVSFSRYYTNSYFFSRYYWGNQIKGGLLGGTRDSKMILVEIQEAKSQLGRRSIAV